MIEWSSLYTDCIFISHIISEAISNFIPFLYLNTYLKTIHSYSCISFTLFPNADHLSVKGENLNMNSTHKLRKFSERKIHLNYRRGVSKKKKKKVFK